ncbi:hypothetical protein MPTK1_8g08400 [Marchantia polymorpha subsp. ruderalis]|uniref:Uncharacterized protein n=1 Tax=Marchantia polymorpha TaxID=3197 RepID=A0A2R6WRS1_MARPO|nr:hypothetical protein MARPO_0063s0078 [Marchantia polymorpha]BBN19166.1 hypothetical protein Mp_8g08400 [Marchantia polymorpha subsp. ruderalis]|eukprot:PTQ36546.1 hypothetical protein MARPO_0063s0078 [Marchantia polymorpha]
MEGQRSCQGTGGGGGGGAELGRTGRTELLTAVLEGACWASELKMMDNMGEVPGLLDTDKTRTTDTDFMGVVFIPLTAANALVTRLICQPWMVSLIRLCSSTLPLVCSSMFNTNFHLLQLFVKL